MAIEKWLHVVAKTGSYNDLLNKPSITSEINIDDSAVIASAKSVKKLNDVINTKANSSHTHTKSQISDMPTSLKNPTALTVQFNGTTNKTYDGSTAQTVNITPSAIGASASSHTHDDRYYTETEINDKLNNKANTSHTHDDRYYTESEIDSKINSINSSKANKDGSLQSNLNADMLDGLHADKFLRSDRDSTTSGKLVAARGSNQSTVTEYNMWNKAPMRVELTNCNSTSEMPRISFHSSGAGVCKQVAGDHVRGGVSVLNEDGLSLTRFNASDVNATSSLILRDKSQPSTWVSSGSPPSAKSGDIWIQI